MSQEVWRDVLGYVGTYQVSNFGRVRSIDRYVQNIGNGTGSVMLSRGKVLKLYKTPKGYLRINFCKQNNRRKFFVHRLVYEAFCGPIPNNHDVCHNNGNPSDNRICNLRADTRSGNLSDKRRHGTAHVGSSHGCSKLDEEQAKEIFLDTRIYRLIAKDYGVSESMVCAIKRKRNWRNIHDGKDIS